MIGRASNVLKKMHGACVVCYHTCGMEPAWGHVHHFAGRHVAHALNPSFTPRFRKHINSRPGVSRWQQSDKPMDPKSEGRGL